MMYELTLDLIGLQTVDEFHDRAAATFDFPAHYGRNRDAFWDCITDFVELTTVRVGNFHSLPDSLKQDLSAYIELLNTNEGETDGTFSVLIALRQRCHDALETGSGGAVNGTGGHDAQMEAIYRANTHIPALSGPVAGSQAFAERMLKIRKDGLGKGAGSRVRKNGGERKAHGAQEAERLIQERLVVAGLTEGELAQIPGSEMRKVAIGRKVWEQTTVSMGWIAERLHTRSRINVSQQNRRHRLQSPKLPKALQAWVVQSTINA